VEAELVDEEIEAGAEVPMPPNPTKGAVYRQYESMTLSQSYR